MPIIVIVGPTASGKSALALDLAACLPGGGEIVSADSMQVYRGMDIGTAKPTPRERSIVPHHLIDIVDPSDETYSVDRWLTEADAAIDSIRGRSKWPIVVGGTNLYVKALLEGLFEGPPASVALRDDLARADLTALRDRLIRTDPAAARRIHPNDRRRTVRALEVFAATGRPISDLQREWDVGRLRDDAAIVGIDMPVEVVNRRINARVRDMFERGLVEEARRLHEAGRLGRQAREALGYKQLIAHFEGRASLDDAIERIKILTRRFAKQQRTWLRRFRAYPRSRWLHVGASNSSPSFDEAQSAIDLALAESRSASGGATHEPGGFSLRA
jgi:tRNA dimethylallyltransferase